MKSESEKIRGILNLVEDFSRPQLLNEGWLSNLADKVDRKLGKRELDRLTNRLQQEWQNWLGQTDREGNIDDMLRFMKLRIGFTDSDIETIISNALPSSDEDEEEEETDENPQDEKSPDEKPSNDQKDEKKPAEPEPQNEPDDSSTPSVVKDNPRKYRKPNGEWDEEKIQQKMETLPVGTTLDLGSIRRKRVANESLVEQYKEPLSTNIVNHLLRKSAAFINDQYLLNGPENDRQEAIARAASAGMRSGSNSRRGQSSRSGSGRYSPQDMRYELDQLDINRGAIDSVRRKAIRADDLSDLSARDKEVLSAIGYAFFRSRT